MSIKIDKKKVSIIPKNQSIDLIDNSFSIDCDKFEVSATPIIFNQIINNTASSDFTWLIVSSNTGVVANNGYIAINNLVIISFSINGIYENGQKLGFFNMGQGGLKILGQNIIFGDKVTLANGYLESLNYGDYISLTYLNNFWVVQQSIGNINIL